MGRQVRGEGQVDRGDGQAVRGEGQVDRGDGFCCKLS